MRTLVNYMFTEHISPSLFSADPTIILEQIFVHFNLTAHQVDPFSDVDVDLNSMNELQ